MLTSDLRTDPDFLVIGTQKGGTTSLYQYLIEHPDVVSASTKEVPSFFSNVPPVVCHSPDCTNISASVWGGVGVISECEEQELITVINAIIDSLFISENPGVVSIFCITRCCPNIKLRNFLKDSCLLKSTRRNCFRNDCFYRLDFNKVK